MENTPNEPPESENFWDDILKPGSSLNPKFLAILDAAFILLLAVLLGLAFLTSGNIHLFALIGIELALWASVKWFVNELKTHPVVNSTSDDRKER